MTKPRKLLYVITDGGRARLMERTSATGDFVTLEEVDHAHALKAARVAARGAPAGRTFESGQPGKHVVGAQDQVRDAKEAFVVEVAGRASIMQQKQGYEGVFLAAPARLIGKLRKSLKPGVPLAGSIGKDLTKIKDHDLHAWFDKVAFGVEPIN